MSDNPAVILYDNLGNPVGVVLDGLIYRLQVQAILTDGYSSNPLGTVGNPLITHSSEAPQKILYDVGDPLIYIGFAPLGTTSDSPLWLIKKVTLSGGNPVSTQWSTTSAIWNNRNSEIYQ